MVLIAFDPDGDVIRYLWEQVGANKNVSLTNKDTSAPTFVAPEVIRNTTLTFLLTITDENGNSSGDLVNVLVSDIKRTPTDIVFSIDSSTSMKDNDPRNLRSSISKYILNALGTLDRAGVISWDKNADFALGLNSNFTVLKSQIDDIDSTGPTNIDSGIDYAINMLDRNTRNNATKTIVFLTDGKGEYTDSDTEASPVNDAKKKGYGIIVIGLNAHLSNGTEKALTDIVNTTKGEYLPTLTMEEIDQLVNSNFKSK